MSLHGFQQCQFALIIRCICLAHSLPISFILQLCYVVIGIVVYEQYIVFAYHEFHTYSKTLHQQVTMARNDRSMQLV